MEGRSSCGADPAVGLPEPALRGQFLRQFLLWRGEEGVSTRPEEIQCFEHHLFQRRRHWRGEAELSQTRVRQSWKGAAEEANGFPSVPLLPFLHSSWKNREKSIKKVLREGRIITELFRLEIPPKTEPCHCWHVQVQVSAEFRLSLHQSAGMHKKRKYFCFNTVLQLLL